MSEYTQTVDTFLEQHSIVMTVREIGIDCPNFCSDKDQFTDEIGRFPRKHHIHGNHYLVTFSRADNKRTVTFDFWNSYADEEQNTFQYASSSLSVPIENNYWDKYGKYPARRRLTARNRPSAYDVLACIQKNEIGSFENFCGDFGYDTDSRKAYAVFEAVTVEYRKVTGFFTAAELETLNEIAV